jgi:GGDEF domain-containing protein
MNNEVEIKQKTTETQAPGNDFMGRVQAAMKKSAETNRPFFILLLKVENLEEFRKKRPDHVVNGFLREMFSSIRMAVHPSQYVGYLPEGVGLIFDAVDPGKVDTIARRLVSLTQNVIRTGHYNDLTSRWTDILQQFLWPNNPGLLFTRVGWAIYPRDGAAATDLLNRARAHVAELAR